MCIDPGRLPICDLWATTVRRVSVRWMEPIVNVQEQFGRMAGASDTILKLKRSSGHNARDVSKKGVTVAHQVN